MRKTLLSTLVAGALAAGFAVPANAQPFYYNAYGGFKLGTDADMPAPSYNNVNVGYADATASGYAPVGPKYPGGNGYPAVTADTVYQQVSWGTPQTGNSSLTINQEGKQPSLIPPWNTITGGNAETAPGYEWIMGSVDVSNEFGSVMGWLTHNNFVIDEPFLGTVGIHYHLDYYADPARTIPVWSSGELEFVLQIWETPNGSNPCADGGANGVGVNINGCADRFGYKVLGATDFGDPFELPIGSFTYDGTNYVVSSSGFFDALGNQLGFAWSGENQNNTFYVNHEVHVPEPASIALMGLGLLGLGVARRRKQTLKA